MKTTLNIILLMVGLTFSLVSLSEEMRVTVDYSNFKKLMTSVDKGVATVKITNGDMNLIDLPMIGEMTKLAMTLENDPNVKVVVFESDNSDYFLAHFDVRALKNIPAMIEKPTELGMWQTMTQLYKHMSKVTIGKVRGIARGAGHEFLLALDMRFADESNTKLGQPEIALGLIPGGGGLVRMTEMLPRNRVMEIALSGNDYDAKTAELYGLINRAVPSEKLDDIVNNLALQIASFDANAIASLKATVNSFEGKSTKESLLEEGYMFNKLGKSEEAQRRLAIGFKNGFQTFEGEKDITLMYPAMADSE